VAAAAGRGRGRRLTTESFEQIQIPVGGTPFGDLVFDAMAAGPPDGAPVLLLHGFPESSYQWRHQLPALAAAGYRVLAPDLRGYSPGARPEAVDAYHIDHLVADVAAFVDHLGTGRVHLVAHDWGAIVAWFVASRHADRLRSLTAVSTGHPLAIAQALTLPGCDQAARFAYVRFFQMRGLPERLLLAGNGAGLRALMASTRFEHKEAMDRYVSRLSEPGALTAALNWYRALDMGALRSLGPVSVPTLYIWSTEDLALGREGAEGTGAYVTGPYRFVELEGISHWIPEDVPEEFNRLLLEHLGNC
jgi:pimeloyl-ACP methyl ester carboxylesterase